MMQHLEASQFLDLDQSGKLGPLFEMPKAHINECPACRQRWVQYQALRALALEASLPVDSRMIRRALQAARRVDVEERLSLETGTENARSILLQEQPGSWSSSWRGLAALLALLMLCTVAWFAYHPLRTVSENPATPAKEALPFEFNDNSPTAAAMSTPALPEDEKAQEEELDTEARRMLLAHLKGEARSSRAEATQPRVEQHMPPPTRSIPKEQRQPSPAPSPTARPTPRPAPSPQPTTRSVERPALAPAAAAQVPAPPTPEAALPGFRVEDARFSSSRGEAARFLLSLPEAASVEIRVFDSSGHSVKLVADGQYGPGNVPFRFNGLNEQGVMLEAGSYFARVMTRWYSRVEALEILP